MSEDKFDVIIVGGGLAGLTAAYVLANAGLEALLVEKGNYSGSKNMTGGRLYGHSLEQIIPGFPESAPVERVIGKERYSFLQNGTLVTKECQSADIMAPAGSSYSVLRGRFDQWLAEQAEEAGAALVYGVRVDDLMIRDGAVCGVIAGEEEMECDVVILADGVNSLLGQKLETKEELDASAAVVGVKEVLELDAAEIEKRFGLAPGEGLAWMFRGCCTEDGICDGFLYTNKDSISLGITMTVSDIDKTELSVPQMLEDFKYSAGIAPLVEGARLAEYSAHLIPEGGAGAIPKLVGDGVLTCGDAAAFCANLGFTLRGMDLAVESGRLAAETVIEAQRAGDYSADTLAAYQKALEQSFIFRCMRGSETCREAFDWAVLQSDLSAAANAALAQASI